MLQYEIQLLCQNAKNPAIAKTKTGFYIYLKLLLDIEHDWK